MEVLAYLTAWERHLSRYVGRFHRFALVGASGVAVNLVVFLAALRLGTVPLVASVAAFCVALTWNFSWNWRWTFRGLAHRSPLEQFGRYALFQSLVLLVNEAILYAVILEQGPSLVGQFLGILAGSGIGYVLNRRWNWSGPSVQGSAQGSAGARQGTST